LIPVTLIVTTYNEERNIEKCLRSAHGFIDQIFVIDSESKDETAAISGRYAEVVNQRLGNDSGSGPGTHT
jgi:glycosyltransferase involved in cell wall biosynthesis